MFIEELLEALGSVSWGRQSDLVALLTIAFVVLRLCHIIDWSWWWVLSPLLLLATLKLVDVLVFVVINVIHRKREKKKSIRP